MDESTRVSRLTLPKGHFHMVLDTDTANEVDDQFAIAYAVRSTEAGEMTLDAIYAAPFPVGGDEKRAGEGMALSYDEACRVLAHTKTEKKIPVLRGSDRYIGTEGPISSPAALDLIDRAMAMPDGEVLYVAAIGAPTNVASALLLEPKIAEKIVVVFLGGTGFYWPNTLEFNIRQDVAASRFLLDCGVPLILCPTYSVTALLRTSVYEIDHFLDGKSEIGTYLSGIVRARAEGDIATVTPDFAWSKIIWDIAAPALLLHPEYTRSSLVHAPVLNGGNCPRWSFDNTRHLIRVLDFIDRDRVFTDVFRKLAK